MSFQEWYEKNGKGLNDDRRKRYADDPEYRKRVQEQNRLARTKRRQENLRQEEQARATGFVPDQTWPVYKQVIGNKEVDLVPIGAAAAAIGCTIDAIRGWEYHKVFPPTPHRSDRGDRLYTAKQIEAMRDHLAQSKRLDSKPPQQEHAWVVVRANGSRAVETIFRIGGLARRVQRAPVTLKQMEERGHLPPTPLRSASGQRYYTQSMADALYDALHKRAMRLRGEESWREFYAEIAPAWKAYEGATVLDVEESPEAAS